MTGRADETPLSFYIQPISVELAALQLVLANANVVVSRAMPVALTTAAVLW